MRLKIVLVLIAINLLFYGCSDKVTSDKKTDLSNIQEVSTSNPAVLNKQNVEIKNDSPIRAQGVSKFGEIIVRASGEEEVKQLNESSSYGKASDYTFNGDYNIIFKNLSNNEEVIGTINRENIPVIIQPQNNPIKLQKVILNENELFIFIPQYTGSNDVPLYIFGINRDGQAFQARFQINTNAEPTDSFSIITTTSPKFLNPYAEGDKLIVNTLMNDKVDSSEIKLFKLSFKLNNNTLVLVSRELVK